MLMTIKEVTSELRLGRTAVYRLIRTHGLPTVVVGGSRRFPRRQFHDWIDTLVCPVVADA